MTSRSPIYALLALLIGTSAIAGAEVQAQAPDSATELVGLWKAKRHFGPSARGRLLLQRTGNTYTADMIGHSLPVRVEDGELFFELPNQQGAFRGKLLPGGSVLGFWFPPRGIGQGGFSTTVSLAPAGPNRWQGEVLPFDDVFTLYLLVQKQPDGSLSALVRNAERDWSAFLGVKGIKRAGNTVQLIARPRGQSRDTVFAGTFDSEQQVITVNVPGRGGTYAFRREGDQSDFYPRGNNSGRYVYRPPPARDDGWQTGTLDEVGIDRAAIERAVQVILDMSMDSMNAPQFHGLLIARNGKVVLEEYFHGEHRDKLHDTRSASKSVTATIAGAAMMAGEPLKLSTPVYQVMNGGAFPPGLELRKRALTLEHLLTMSSGYFCDDNNEAAPGREDTIWSGDEPDFYKVALALPMVTTPGDIAVYCSINPHLALGVVGTALGESPFYLFHRLLAEPMSITRYAWGQDGVRHPYGGGGMQFLPRDFMKFGQLMLDSGTWRGRRLLSTEFVGRATSPLYRIGSAQRGYGLAWWPSETQDAGGRTLRRFSALGNGGQTINVYPELDLVIATYGGNYATTGWRFVTGEFITKYVLPAVRE